MRAWDCLAVRSAGSLTLRTTLEEARLLLVSLAEGLAEERAEAVVGIARHFLEDVAIELPVALLRRSAQEAAALRVALELLLERIGVEGGEHRSEERRVGKECRSRWWRHHQRKSKRESIEDHREEDQHAQEIRLAA